MGELLAIFVGGIVILALAWAVVRPQAEFVVTVRGGKPEATRGKVTEAFLAAVADVCQEFGLQSAEVRGVKQGQRIALQFSTGFPQTARQRLRNWWVMSGWSAKPGGR